MKISFASQPVMGGAMATESEQGTSPPHPDSSSTGLTESRDGIFGDHHVGDSDSGYSIGKDKCGGGDGVGDEGEDEDEGVELAADYVDDGTDADQEEEEEEEEGIDGDEAGAEEGGRRAGRGMSAVRRPPSIQEMLAWQLMGRMPLRPVTARSWYVPYEEAIPRALTRGLLWQEIRQATGAAVPSARNRAAPLRLPLDASYDSSMFASQSAPYGLHVRQAIRQAVVRDPRVAARCTLLGPQSVPPDPPDPTPSSPRPSSSIRADTPAASAAEGVVAAAAQSPSPSSSIPGRRCSGTGHSPVLAPAAAPAPPPVPPPGYLTGLPCPPCPRLLMRREWGEGAGGGGALGAAVMRHLQGVMALPRYPREVVDRLESRAYIGQFSGDGQFFVAAFQDRRVRLYDVERGWRLRKDITTQMCRWTITDTSISPDQRFVLYASITPVVHLVEVGSVYDSVSSICNVTQVHEPLSFDIKSGGFGIWSVQWSGDGREIVVGNNDSSVLVMDVETKRVVAAVNGHDDDVNAVTYADAFSNIIVSGSDDTYIKVWDRRMLPGPPSSPDPSSSFRGGAGGGRYKVPLPAGVLCGHTEGLTHLHARGDGLHMLSNSKDQTAKVWDLRMMRAGGSLRDAPSASRLSSAHVPQFNWDYRWQDYPAAGRVVRHPHDSSVQTFRGHTVRNTLIRAYFSPAHSTGQRFVYTGSAEGDVHVYDVVSGQEVDGSPLRLHSKLVRDCSWHPYDPVLATVSWDGTVVRWDAAPPGPGSRALQLPEVDAFDD